MEINKIYQGDALEALRTFPGDSIDCICTSPPYWGLRYYKCENQVWGGDTVNENSSLYPSFGGRARNMRPNEEGRNMRDIWTINTEPSGYEHFATFPRKLVERILLSGCPEGGLVLDPFCGIGTTLITAKRMGMNYLGIELSEEYYKMATERLASETAPLF